MVTKPGGSILDADHPRQGVNLPRRSTVQLVGFGSFAAKHCPARTGCNRATGAPIAVQASRAVSFRAGKGLRDAVNRKTG